jgi:glycosyltransferase involved in cell wall biosynthesis
MSKISIVLPSYNGEKYIRESIESVLKQTFSDWELIIVNDCSVDSTPEIAEEYVKKDARIRVIHNVENKKLPESLNIGFREAQGEFLTWTSDDNLYYPEALGTMYQYLEEHQEVPFVCADMEKINAEGESEGSFVLYDERKIFLNNCIGACFLYRRLVLEEVGEYNATEFLVEDYDYWLRIKKRFGKLGYIAKCLYAYRVHENSLTATREQKIREQLL